jgi:uncharacterized protein YjbI with pentapeptide repeats
MANPEYVAKLKEGVEAWNSWRKENYPDGLDLRRADLSGKNLSGANLSGAILYNADLRDADLRGANFSRSYLEEAILERANLERAVLRDAHLGDANLFRANLNNADLKGANLFRANLFGTNLSGANLSEAHVNEADLREANLREANLIEASLSWVDFTYADLSGADMRGASLRWASLIETILERANLTNCDVYGVSVWNIRLEGANQSNLRITPPYEPIVQVDNLEVAQFVYLLLNNERIRHVIDTITSKVVLILGRFGERKIVLDAIRDELRKHNYVPILFDFEIPKGRDMTDTVTALAKMARFVIADLTDPSCIPYELATIVPTTKVPVQTIILDGKYEFAMFNNLLAYPWMLPPYRYRSEKTLLASLNERVIAPAEAKVIELRQK